jgi:hypothetical protein
MTEFGYALFYTTTTDGAQNNTIRNCRITLNNTNVNTFGIYSNTQHSSTSGTISANITNFTGTCSNNIIQGNTIENCSFGVCMIGMPTTATLYNTGIDIGGTSAATGNTITNHGYVTGTVSGYVGMPGSAVAGVLVSHCTGVNIAYNSISGSSPINTYGVYLRMTGTSITNSFTSNILNNNITETSTSGSTSWSLIGVLNDLVGSNHTVNINGNTIQSLTTTNSSFGGVVAGIMSNAALLSLNANNNTLQNFTIAGGNLGTAAATRPSAIKISNVISNSISLNGNTINNIDFNNTGTGNFVCFDVNGNYTGTCTISNNNANDIVFNGNGGITGYTNTGSPSGALTISNNQFTNCTVNGSATTDWLKFVHSFTGASQVININTNTIQNLTINTAAVNANALEGIYVQTSNNVTIHSNLISNLLSGVTNYGIRTSGGSGPQNIYNNTVSGLSSAAGGGQNHMGLDISPSLGTANIYGNRVYNMSSLTSTNANVWGMRISGGTTNVYNNMVGDLKMPAVSNSTNSVLRGISLSTPTSAAVYNNTVYLNATSTGVDFSSACLTFAGTTSTDLRNNILINASTPKGVGFSAAIMRSAVGTAGTVPATFLTTSNNNCLYAPSVTNGVVFVEGQNSSSSFNFTNAIQASCFDLSAYKAYMTGGRETNTFSEIPPFISTTAGAMDLHLSSAIASGCINTGETIALASPDIDGTNRPIGAAYEIGADEVAGIAGEKTPPTVSYTNISDIGCISTTTLVATITDANGVASGANAPRLYYKKTVSFDNNNNIATANNNSTNGWKFVVATGPGPYTFTLDYSLLPGGFNPGDSISYFVTAQDPSGNVAATNATVSPCPTTVQFTSAQTAVAPPSINFFVYKNVLSGAYSIPGSYPTLTGNGGLFQAINNGYVGGNITVTVTADVLETSVHALNQWTEYNTVTCSLIGSPAFALTIKDDGSLRTIQQASNLSQSMIRINGADRVRFSGGSGTTRNLRFINIHTTPTSAYSVFNFENGAFRDTLENCDIQTNSTATFSSSGAGRGAITLNNAGTSFDSVVVSGCTIHEANTTIPNYGIIVESNASQYIKVLNCDIYNFDYRGINCAGALGDACVFTGNHFYKNITANHTNTYVGIDLQPGSSAGSYTITDNVIGGQSRNGGIANTPWVYSPNTNPFYGIRVSSHSPTSKRSTIQNNIVQNINCSGTNPGFWGFDITGLVDIFYNRVGSTDQAFDITVGQAVSPSNCNIYGIFLFGNSATSGIFNIKGNTIAYIDQKPSSVSSSGVARLHGIYTTTFGNGSTVVIDSNVVTKLLSNSGTSSTTTADVASTTSSNNMALVGINNASANGRFFVRGNIIDSLVSNAITTTAQSCPSVIGIGSDCVSSGGMTASGNVIYKLENKAQGRTANPGGIAGIRFVGGLDSAFNNMISITNSGNTVPQRIIGLYDFATTTKPVFYNNTVYVGGSQTTSNTAPYSTCYFYNNTGVNGESKVWNNVFVNERSGGGTAKQYVMYFAVAPSPATNFKGQTNNMHISTASTNFIGYKSTATQDMDSTAYKTFTAETGTYFLKNPVFFNKQSNLHIDSTTNCHLNGTGTSIVGIPDVLKDIDKENRGTPPDMGADEFNFNPATKSTITTNPVCEDNPLNITGSTLAPGPLTYSWTVPTGVTNPGNTNVYATASASTINAGTYTMQVTDVYGCVSKYDSVITVNTNNWLGVDTDWTNPLNWSCGVPTATKNASIPGALANYPIIITGVNAACKNLTIANSASLTTTGTGTLSIANTYSSNGTLTNNGTLILNGSTAQSFPGSTGTIAAMNNLTLNNSSGANPAVTLNNNFSLSGILTPGSSIVNIPNNVTITLASTATGTARVAEVGGSFTYTGTGSFRVQRYFPARRSWRLLTTPLWQTGSIFNTWQNAGVYSPGVGMLVTGNPVANGLDASPLNNFSMRGWNVATQAYTNINNTNATLLGENVDGIADNNSFFTFVRGDRDPANTTIPNTNITTLSATGRLQTGTQTFGGLAATAGQFTLIGNPYASPVNFNNITRNNVVKRFYAWDPNLNVVGGFVVLDDLDNDNTYIKDIGVSVQDTVLQSSQAFFVNTNNLGGLTNVVFDENDKSPNNNLALFRPSTPTAATGQWRTNLYRLQNGQPIFADGNVMESKAGYNGGIDVGDAMKLSNINETFGLRRNGTVLAIERYPELTDGDTVFYNLGRTSPNTYRLEFVSSLAVSDNLIALLEDKFLNTATLINISGTTQVEFTTTTDVASSATDRFRVVFQKPTPVPVSFGSLRAWQQQQQIAVQWQVHQQVNVGSYIIEKSADGRNFSTAGTIAVQNLNGSYTYNWLDAAPFAGNNFYRIRSTDVAGQTQYSSIAKVWMGNGPKGVLLYPNPVSGTQAGLQMSNMPAGQYHIRILNIEGQLLQQQLLQHSGGSALQTLQLNSKMASGQYNVEVWQGKEKVAVLPMLLQN